MTEKSADDIVLEMAALKGLAHPLRVQIIDALSAYGPATASSLAERLGESSGATSYHLRQLERHGFVQEDTARGSGRERWWQRVPRPITLDATGFDRGSAEMAASELVVAEWQRTRQLRLNAYLMHGMEALGTEWMEAGGVSTTNLQLTIEQMKELDAELHAVADKYREKYRNQRVAGARPVQMHLDLFAIVDGAIQGPADVGGSQKDEQ